MKKDFFVPRWAIEWYIRISCIKRRRSVYISFQMFFISLILINSGCSSLNTASQVNRPDHERSAFARAAMNPHTWQPLAAAVLIAATDSDESISDWASENNPVFGSQSTAQDASDFLRGTLMTTAVVTSVVAPGPESMLVADKAINLGFAAVASLTNSKLTGALKDETHRTRPHGESTTSFPSSHTSAASTYATIASYRVNELALSTGMKNAWVIGFRSLAAATGWARIEANAHYPVDVLTGYALGNFITVWLHEMFSDPSQVLQFNLELDRRNNAFKLNFSVPF